MSRTGIIFRLVAAFLIQISFAESYGDVIFQGWEKFRLELADVLKIDAAVLEVLPPERAVSYDWFVIDGLYDLEEFNFLDRQPANGKLFTFFEEYAQLVNDALLLPPPDPSIPVKIASLQEQIDEQQQKIDAEIEQCTEDFNNFCEPFTQFGIDCPETIEEYFDDNGCNGNINSFRRNQDDFRREILNLNVTTPIQHARDLLSDTKNFVNVQQDNILHPGWDLVPSSDRVEPFLAQPFPLVVSFKDSSPGFVSNQDVFSVGDVGELFFEFQKAKDSTQKKLLLQRNDPSGHGNTHGGVAIEEEFEIEQTHIPTIAPTERPTPRPTRRPTSHPTPISTAGPTAHPTRVPTAQPTVRPTDQPTSVPTSTPTKTPTSSPTATPTSAPTTTPTSIPTPSPTPSPTSAPTLTPEIIVTITMNEWTTVTVIPKPWYYDPSIALASVQDQLNDEFSPFGEDGKIAIFGPNGFLGSMITQLLVARDIHIQVEFTNHQAQFDEFWQLISLSEIITIGPFSFSHSKDSITAEVRNDGQTNIVNFEFNLDEGRETPQIIASVCRRLNYEGPQDLPTSTQSTDDVGAAENSHGNSSKTEDGDTKVLFFVVGILVALLILICVRMWCVKRAKENLLVGDYDTDDQYIQLTANIEDTNE